MPYELTLALATGIPAVWALWRTRRSTPLFDLGVWLLSLALLASAVRGLMFFGIISVAVCQRCVLRARASGVSLLPGDRRRQRPHPARARRQLHGDARRRRRDFPLDQAAGRAGGNAARAWPRGRRLGRGGDRLPAREPAARSHAEPRRRAGRRRHLLDPGRARVRRFAPGIVPARLPARGAGRRDGRRRAGQADRRYDVSVGVRRPHAARAARAAQALLRAGWQPVYVDSAHLVVVRPVPATDAYRRQRAIDLARAQPGDLVAAPAALREQQSQNFAAFMSALEQARAR